jgi:hypothetical protein
MPNGSLTRIGEKDVGAEVDGLSVSLQASASARRCGGSVAFADRIRFQGRRMGRDIAGRQVGRARAAREYAETRETAITVWKQVRFVSDFFDIS